MEELVLTIKELQGTTNTENYKGEITKMVTNRETIPKTKLSYDVNRYNEALTNFYNNSYLKASEILRGYNRCNLV